MDNLTYIAFISLTISLGLMLPLMEKKVRRLVIFMIVGIFSCLFVSEVNNILLGLFNNDIFYVTTTITPVTEEIVKMLPIIYFALVISDEKRALIPNAFAVGVGFALLENIVILTQNGICSVMVGWGISYIRKRRKFFFCGTFALLSAAIIYHSIYNLLVQSPYQYFGILLPLATYIPLIIILKKKGIKATEASGT